VGKRMEVYLHLKTAIRFQRFCSYSNFLSVCGEK
jgi:hypothetical protein